MVKKKWSAPLVLVAVVVLAALGLALVGFTPQQFGHPVFDAKMIKEKNSASCFGTSCSVQCSPGYMVFSGSCSSSPTPQWNLFGARADHQTWDCVNGAGDPFVRNIVAKVECVKTEFSSSYIPVCGNYIVDSSEFCDGPNILDIDCTDYFLSTGAQLCNGTMGVCESGSDGCDGLNVSSCEYCANGPCSAPQIECADDTCNLDCTGNGGPKQSSGTKLDSGTPPSGGWYFPPGSPLPSPPVGPGPTAPFCGDGIPFNSPGEECDPPGAQCGSPVCMDVDGANVMIIPTCDDSCKCAPVNTGNACSIPPVSP